jgi:hypothetical protein
MDLDKMLLGLDHRLVGLHLDFYVGVLVEVEVEVHDCE